MKPRRIVLAALILLVTVNAVLGNIVASLLQTSLDANAKYVVVPFFLITAILLLWELQERSPQSEGNRSEDSASRNRRAMIEKVRAIWITGVLNESLYKETLITLRLAKRSDAVERPMDFLVQRPGKADQHLPPGARIIDVYDGLGSTLLILGAPGSGKTTLLLELTRDLLERAERDTDQPIPVVFPLSTWAEQRLPLTDWLVDELSKRYDVPRKIGQAWVKDNQILPLLDGLDEVKGGHRTACVEAINTFRHSHGLLPLVISSRMADYEAIEKQLRLQGAIVLQQLTHEQVDYYLQQGGEPLAAIRQALYDDPTLWELLDTPLMLHIVTLAYAEQSVVALQIYGTLEERLRHIFSAYVDRMFQRRSPVTRYTPEQTVHWLRWLAQHMAQYGLTVFYIEGIHPAWLPNWMQRWLVRGATTVMSGLLGCVLPLLLGCTLSVVLAISIRLELSLLTLLLLSALWLLIPGLLGGVLGGIVGARRGWAAELLRWSWRDMQVGLGKWLSWGMLLGVLFGVISGAYNPPKNAHALPTSWRVGGMLVGVFVGAILSLFNRFFGRWLFGERSGFLLGRVSLCVMLILGVAGVLGGAQLTGAGIGGMFFIGLSAAFIGIGTGLTRKKMENRQRPNEGIRRAFQSALLAGTCYGFLTTLPLAVIYGYIFIPIVWSDPTGFTKEVAFFIADIEHP